MKSTTSSTRNTKPSTAFRALVLALALMLLPVSDALAGDIAFDLQGGYTAADPAAVDAMNYTEEAEPVVIDMDSADVVIGYIAPETASLNPTSCTEWSLISINHLMFESLVDLDENMKPVPMLADSWEHEGKERNFKIRSGIQFHNGVELTAYDVVRSYETFASASSDNPYFGRLSLIDSMEATDILNLRVYANTYGLATLYALTFPVMQYTTLADEIPRGTGPYWFIQRYDDGRVRLEANPLWWKQQPEVRSVLLKRYPDAGDALVAIQTNQIDMLSTNSPKASFSRKLADLTSMDYTTLTYEFLLPNISSNSMMSSLSVRQAVMYAIDRSTLASNGYLDMAVQSEVPIPPSSWLYESQSAIYYYSPERALQLMNNLGWRDMTGNGKLNRMNGIMLEEPNITIVTYNESTNSIRENAANLIADYLETIGFNVNVVVSSRSEVRRYIRNRNYDLALIGVNLSEVPGLSPLLGREGSLNLNGFGTADMEQMLAIAGSTPDENELIKVYSDIQMYVVNWLPIMGLLFRTGTVLSSRSLGGMKGIRCYDAFNGFEFLKMG